VVQLDFPAVPSFYVDPNSTVITGALSETALGRITLTGAMGSSHVDVKERLRVECGIADPAWLSMPTIGSCVRMQVRLHRCVRTDRVVGGVLEVLLDYPDTLRSAHASVSGDCLIRRKEESRQ
jgi:hypothetical protein